MTAENIFTDVTNEELDVETLLLALTDEDEDADWKEWAKDEFTEFVHHQAVEGVFHSTFEYYQAHVLLEFFESVQPYQLAGLRQAQIEKNQEDWDMWMMSLVMNLEEEVQYRYDLVIDMYEVDWFNNENTGGCYGSVDFAEDIESLELNELKLMRGAQLSGASKDDYDKLCNYIFGVAA